MLGRAQVLHSFPEEHHNGRRWADHIPMKVPCSLIGTTGAHVDATLSVICGTIGVGPLQARAAARAPAPRPRAARSGRGAEG